MPQYTIYRNYFIVFLILEKVFTTLQSILHETLANLEIHQSLLHSLMIWLQW